MSARTRFAAALAALLAAIAGPALALSSGDTQPGPGPTGPDAVDYKIERELPSLRTETSRTYQTNSGARLARLYSTPVNFRRDGRWERIDSTLEVSASGSARNRAGRLSVELPQELAEGVEVADGGASMAFALHGSRAARELAGASATYRSALHDVDVRYDVLGNSLKETLTLRGRGASRRFRFRVRLSDGLRVEPSDGGLRVIDAEDDVRFVVPAPIVWDAASVFAPSTDPARLSYDAATSEVVVEIADGYVDDPGRRFPVSVDPWITLPAAGGDCTLSALATEQTTSFCADGFLHVGTVGDHDHHALIDFDVAARLPEQITILEATPALYIKGSYGGVGADYAMHALTRPWINGQATWQRASSLAAWTRLGGDFNSTPAHVKHTNGATGWHFWPMQEQVQRWAEGTERDYGLLVKPVTANGGNGLILSSRENTANQPYIDVLYWPIMGSDGPFSFASESVGSTRSAVNVASGRLTVYDRDAAVSSAGPGFALERFYNSADTECCPKAGIGWRLPLATIREAYNGDITIATESGTWLRFPVQTNGTYGPDRFGTGATVTRTSTGWTLERPDSGDRLLFDTNERLVRRESTTRSGAVTYTYDTLGRVATITDAAQGVTRFAYTTTGSGRLATATLPNGQVVTYSVVSDRLQSRTIAGATTTYGYDATGLLSRLATPTGTVKYTYDTSGRVKTMTRVTDFANDSGPTTRLDYYSKTQLGTCPPESAGRSVETMPDGNTVTYCYDARLEVIDLTSTAAESPALEEVAARQYVSEFNVSPATARAALSLQNRADGLSELILDSPADAGYAGVWFDNTGRRVKVGLKTGTDATPVHQAISDLGIQASTDVIFVAHTHRELEQSRDAALAQLADLVTAQLVSGSYDSSRNAVIVDIANSLTAAQRSRVDAAVAAASARTIIEVQPVASLAEVLTDCNPQACDPPLRGGVRISTEGGGCTGAFVAHSRSDNLPYLLSAGHCFDDPNERDDPWQVANPAGGPSRTIGSFHNYHVGGEGDFGIVRINDEPFGGTMLRNYVYVSGGRLQDGGRLTRLDPTYEIHRSRRNKIGFALCYTGQYSETICGRTARLGKMDGPAKSIGWLKRFRCGTDTQPRPGDSGAPFFKKHAAFGILRGYLPQTCYTTYSGAIQAEDKLRVSIRTSR